jgi:hypothetical protein
MLNESDKLKKLLDRQLLRYPVMEIQDLYKLLYQAAMGSEHVLSEFAAARSRIQDEINSFTGGGNVRCESISPDGTIFRIHLRPFAENPDHLDAIGEAFVLTYRSSEGSTARLRLFWSAVEQICSAGHLPFEPFQLRQFFFQQEDNHFAAVHHSSRYHKAYRPAYRVVSSQYLPSFLANDAGSSPGR